MLVKFLFCLNCTILIEGATENQNAVRHMKLYCMIFVISSFVRKEGVSKELQRRKCLSITAALLYKRLFRSIGAGSRNGIIANHFATLQSFLTIAAVVNS